VRAVRPRETLWAALWRSSAEQALAKTAGHTRPRREPEEPLLDAVDRSLDLLEQGKPVPKPKGKSEDDPDVAAYLSMLHHRKAHADMAANEKLQEALTGQLAEFIYGNPAWQEMLIQYCLYYGQYPYHTGGTPQYRSWQDEGNHEQSYGTVAWQLPTDATVAIVGDVGTGTDIAAGTLNAVMSFKPDAILHLGDVYYSGTPFEMEHSFMGLLDEVFDACKRRVPVFTVPGNHEYFTGNIPLLACFDSGRLAVTGDQRQQASYFCLRTGDDGWQFLGLDTGFYGHMMSAPAADQQAALELLLAEQPGQKLDPTTPIQLPAPPGPMVKLRDDEVAWQLDKLHGFKGRSVLLSHHQLYSAVQTCGVAPTGPDDPNRQYVNTALWQQLGAAFTDNVAAWFWGHEHNLGVFQDGYRPADWPTDIAANYPALPIGRCAGHAAIPVAAGENPYATTWPVPLAEGTQLGLTAGWYNRGFEILKLHGTGKPADARYFQLAGAEAKPALVHEEQIA
jgi:hypothetical protein